MFRECFNQEKATFLRLQADYLQSYFRAISVQDMNLSNNICTIYQVTITLSWAWNEFWLFCNESKYFLSPMTKLFSVGSILGKQCQLLRYIHSSSVSFSSSAVVSFLLVLVLILRSSLWAVKLRWSLQGPSPWTQSKETPGSWPW